MVIRNISETLSSLSILRTAPSSVPIASSDSFIILPSLITDHVIIPELKLAFVTENDYAKFASTERRVHSRRFVALKKLHLSNERMKFNRKAAASLLESAAATLQKAKSVHDELEAFYIGAMDFKALDSYYEGFLKNI